MRQPSAQSVDPPGFLAELKRRKVYRTGAGYAVAAFVISEAADIALPALGMPPTAMTFVVVVALAGFPVALALAWAFEIVPQPRSSPAAGSPGTESDAPHRSGAETSVAPPRGVDSADSPLRRRGADDAGPTEPGRRDAPSGDPTRADPNPADPQTADAEPADPRLADATFPDTESPERPPPAPDRRRIRLPRVSTVGRGLRLAVVCLTCVACGGLAWTVLPHPVAELPEDGRMLIADLENQAGDTIFDYALVDALQVGLAQSEHLRIVSDAQVRAALQTMRRDPAEGLDEATALELALRQSVTAVLVPSIQRVGTRYRLSTRVLDPADGTTLVSRASEAESAEEILRALDDLARQLRRDLGESLASMVRRRVPLDHATTHSLEALRAWTDGNRHFDAGRQQEAFRMYRRAVELDSTFALAHSSLGQHHYWARDDPISGQRHFDAALRHSESVTERERLMIQGKAAEWSGDRESAATAYRALTEQYPDDDVAWGNLAYQQMRLGRTDEAAASFRRVLELDSLDANALINLATVYAIEGELERADDQYRRAFRIAPGYRTSTGILHEFGLNLVRMGRIEEAERVYTEWTEDGPAALRAQGLRSTGMIRFLQGRFRDAEELLRRAIVLNRSTSAYTSEARNLGYLIEARLRRGAPVDDELDAAVDLVVENYIPSYWVHLTGVWLARAGRIAEAETLLDSARARVDDEARTRAGIMRLEGEIALARQDEATAIERLGAAATIDPQWRLPHATLAELSLSAGEIEAAESHLRDVLGSLDHAPGDEGQVEWVLARYRLARVLERLGRVDEARENYERFLDFWGGGDEDLAEVATTRERLRALTAGSAAAGDATDPSTR